jgi:hypothetical protein
MTIASTIMKGNSDPESGRSFQPLTIGSNLLQRAETVDAENEVPQSSSVIAATLRVETPLMTISIKASTRACSLRW